MTFHALRKETELGSYFEKRSSELQSDNVANFPSLGIRQMRRSDSHSRLDREWAELLEHLRQFGASTRAAEDRASKIAAESEAIARRAVEQSARSAEAAEVSRAAERLALERADEAEHRLGEAEIRAQKVERELAEKNGLLARLQDELWQLVSDAHAAQNRNRATATAP